GAVIGSMPAHSWWGQPIEAWVLSVAWQGRYGEVVVPYETGNAIGWIDLRGLHRSRTAIRVDAQLSAHRIVVLRDGRVVLRATAGTGAAATPTPPGRYFVTDRVL